MCGRYTVFTEDEIIEMREIIAQVNRKFGEGAVATGDIYPTNIVPILTLDSNQLAPRPASWGFPKWDGKGVHINAKSETALELKSFSKSLLTRRCVIPSTGFYEWTTSLVPESHDDPESQLSFFPIEKKPKAKEQKVQLHFRCPNEPMLYMAGMMNTFHDKDGHAKDAFVILTTAANASMASFHDRMPVILSATECEDWIDSEAFMRQVLARESAMVEWKVA